MIAGVTLWRTRVIWALVGACAALAITSLREPSESSRRAPARTLEGVAATVAATPVPTPPAATPHAEPIAPLVSDATTPSSSEVPPEPVATTPATTLEPTTISTPAVAEPFEIPLPLMPGARVMKRSQQPDEEHGGTLYTLALSVPAPGMQVESFYRSALADAKLVVTGGSREPSTIGSGRRSSLRGRGRDAIVHVNLQQRGGTLRTIVRILWRTLP